MRVYACRNGQYDDRAAIRAALATLPVEGTTIVGTRDEWGREDLAVAIARAMGFDCEVCIPRSSDSITHRGTLWRITMLYAFDTKPDRLLTFGSARSPLVREAIAEAARLGIPVARF